MRFWKTLAGLALLATLASQTAEAEYNVRYLTIRAFPQKAGGTGTEVSGTLRGIDVNTNVGSPYYGYVYICDISAVSPVPTPPPTEAQTVVLIYKPIGNGRGNAATKYEDTGLRILVNSSTSQFASVQGGHGVSVGPDDTVWICDFSERQIESAPPVPPGTDTTVTATPRVELPTYDPQALAELPSAAGWTVGHPRNLHVARAQGPEGPEDILLVANNTSDSVLTDQTIQKFTLDGTTATYQWTRPIADLGADPTVNDGQGGAGYDVTSDPDGNVYVPLRALSGEVAIRKYNRAGEEVAFTTAPLSPFQFSAANQGGTQTVSVDANWPGIAFVADPTVAGGGYLYYLGRVGAQNRQHGGRYALDGSLLEPMGTNFTNNPVPGNILGYLEADDTGNMYVRLGNSGGNANQLKVFTSHPYVATGDDIKSSPATSADGVTYFGSNDGKLYAIDDATGSAPAGTAFPVDILTPAGGVILGRVTIRDVGTGSFLYFTTSNGRVGRVPTSGDMSAAAGAWLTEPLVTSTTVAVTPAVTDADGTGNVYVAMGDGVNPATLFRLDVATGATSLQQALSPATEVQSSPSVVYNNVYVGTNAGTFRVMDTGSSLIVSAGAGSATPGSPFVHLNSPNGPAMYVVDSTGTVFARNAMNFNTIAAFDGDADPASGPQSGEVALGVTVQSSLFAWNNILYVGGLDNKVYAVNESNGTGAGPAGYVFFDAGPGGGISKGVAISPGGPSVSDQDPGGLSVIFGSTNGRYYQVRAADPAAYRAWAGFIPQNSTTAVPYPDPLPLDTAPSVDRATETPGGVVTTEFIGSDHDRVFRFPRF